MDLINTILYQKAKNRNWVLKISFLILFVFQFFIFNSINAQTPEPTETPTNNTEQQIENSTENNEDAETEDDSYVQQMQQLIKNPININTADEAQLKELIVLTPLQIANSALSSITNCLQCSNLPK